MRGTQTKKKKREREIRPKIYIHINLTGKKRFLLVLNLSSLHEGNLKKIKKSTPSTKNYQKRKCLTIMQSSWSFRARNIWTPAITSAHTSGLLYRTLQSPYVKLNIHQLPSHLIIPTRNNEFQALYNFTVLMS